MPSPKTPQEPSQHFSQNDQMDIHSETQNDQIFDQSTFSLDTQVYQFFT